MTMTEPRIHNSSLPAGKTVLSVRDVAKSFGGVHAVRGEIGRAHV